MTPKRQQVLVTIDSTPDSVAPLTLALVLDAPARRGRPISGRLAAEGGTGGYVYAIASGSLPAGCSLNTTTGVISGTPSVLGKSYFKAEVQDSSSTLVQANFVIEVVTSLVAVAGKPVPGEVGITYSFDFRISGNTGAVTWSMPAGSLPSGLSGSSAGHISGTPTTDGVAYFTMRAHDAGTGEDLDIRCSIKVWPALEAGFVEEYLGLDTSQLSLPTVMRGLPYAAHAYSNGNPGVVFNVTELPAGFAANAAGVVSGVTDEVRGYHDAIVLTATDALGGVFQAGFYLPTQAPQFAIATAENGVDKTPPFFSKYNFVDGTGTTAAVTPNADGSATVKFNASGGGGGSGLVIPLFSGNASTKSGSAQKLVLGSQYFDPTDPAHGLSGSSTATLCMLLESTSGSVNAQGELFQKSGTGSPQVIAATSTTAATTATLVTADVSAAFTDTSPAGIFCARLWTGTPNGVNQATCTGAWIEVTA